MIAGVDVWSFSIISHLRMVPWFSESGESCDCEQLGRITFLNYNNLQLEAIKITELYMYEIQGNFIRAHPSDFRFSVR